MISGHRWRHALSTRLTISCQTGSRMLIYQTCLVTHDRVANWDGFPDISSARRWVRSQSWPGVIQVVEQ